MASNINANNIDGTYPIAGQDNDSQGFRTNFTNIKNNLTFAKSEIEDLQSKAVLKSALSGTTLDNDMAGSLFRGAEVRDLRETAVTLPGQSGTVELNHASGHYYSFSTTGSVTLSFVGFPAAGKLGRIRLEVSVSNVAHTLTLPAAVSYGIEGISGIDSSNVITFSETGTFVFEFTTEDGGTTVHIDDLSRPRDYFHSTQIRLKQRSFTTSNDQGQAGDIPGMIAVDGTNIYVCTGTYDGSTVIWKKVALTSIT